MTVPMSCYFTQMQAVSFGTQVQIMWHLVVALLLTDAVRGLSRHRRDDYYQV